MAIEPALKPALPVAPQGLASALLVAGLTSLCVAGCAHAAARASAPASAPRAAGVDKVTATAVAEPLGLQLQTSAPWTVLAVRGLAARAGVHTGDHVLAVNGQPLGRADQLPLGLSRETPSAALLVEREGREIFIPLHWP